MRGQRPKSEEGGRGWELRAQDPGKSTPKPTLVCGFKKAVLNKIILQSFLSNTKSMAQRLIPYLSKREDDFPLLLYQEEQLKCKL